MTNKDKRFQHYLKPVSLTLLLLLLAAGWRHMDQSPCANARTALGFDTKTDRWGAIPPNTRIRFTAVAGHS